MSLEKEITWKLKVNLNWLWRKKMLLDGGADLVGGPTYLGGSGGNNWGVWSFP